MNTKATVSVCTLVFVLGIATGIAGSRSEVFDEALSKGSSGPSNGGSAKAATIRGLLAEVTGNPGHFILTGTNLPGGRCDAVVTATFHDEYMEVEQAKGLDFFVPYSAIYRINRTGPGSVEIPVVSTNVSPFGRFCGD